MTVQTVLRGLPSALIGLILLSAAHAQTPLSLASTAELPQVVSGTDGRQLLAAGDVIVARGLVGRDARYYYLVRPAADTGLDERWENIGRRAMILGEARVINPGSPALLRIERAHREIRPGDYLMAVSREAEALDSH